MIIGTITEHIVSKGYTLTIMPRKDMLLLSIGKQVDEKVFMVNWALSHMEIASAPDSLLMDTCGKKIIELEMGAI